VVITAMAALSALRGGGGPVRVVARRPAAVPGGGVRGEGPLFAAHGDRGSGLGLGFGGGTGADGEGRCLPTELDQIRSGTMRAFV
jgi:hypothetical protein